MQMEDSLTTLEPADGLLHGVLSISFSGPYLYDFRPEYEVDIYAPFCPLHEAGFFYSDNSRSETDLWTCAQEEVVAAGQQPLNQSQRIYEIKGPGIRSNWTQPTILDRMKRPHPGPKATKILAFGKHASPTPRFDKMLFKLSVPVPQYIYPLYTDLLEVVDGYSTMPSGTFLSYATGFRFFYPWDGKSDVHLKIPTGKLCLVTPPVFSELPKIADIEVRYAGPDCADRNDPHSDARSCFASLAALAGCEKWLNYGDQLSSPTNPSHGSAAPVTLSNPCADIGEPARNLLQHTGGDCHPPVIALGLDAI